jgi:hypothetical protein
VLLVPASCKWSTTIYQLHNVWLAQCEGCLLQCHVTSFTVTSQLPLDEKRFDWWKIGVVVLAVRPFCAPNHPHDPHKWWPRFLVPVRDRNQTIGSLTGGLYLL